MLYSIVAMLVVILDQAVKYWVTNTIMGYDVVTAIPGVLSLVCVPNDGAAFSLLSGGGARIYFIIVTVVFCVAVILALATNFVNGRVARWCLVMVAAGGFANCIDRVIYGYVIDMFKVDLFSSIFNFPIFNVADIFITVFAIIFAVCIIFERKPKDEDEEDYEEEEEEEDDYQEEPKKARKGGLLSRFRRDDDEEDEDEDEEPLPPRKSRKARYEDEYKEYKAQQRPVSQARPQRQAPAQNADPFAAWEKANAKAEASRRETPAARAMAGQRPQQPTQAQPAGHYRPPVQRPSQPVSAPAQATPGGTYTRPAAPAQPVQQPAPRPAAAPVQAPAAKPKASDSDFSLEDILNEFK